MDQNNLDKIITGNIDQQIDGLERATEDIDAFYDVCLNALESSSDGIFIAERLRIIKNILETKLFALFERTNKPEVRFNIAAIIYEDLTKYDHIKKYLLDFIRTHDWPEINTPLFILRQRKVKEIIPITIQMLEKVDVNDIDHANFLLDTIRSLQVDLPENIRNKFSSPEVPWQVRIK